MHNEHIQPLGESSDPPAPTQPKFGSHELGDVKWVLSQLGGVSSMTLFRWRNDERLGFPKPRRIRGRLYFMKNEVADWIARQAEEEA